MNQGLVIGQKTEITGSGEGSFMVRVPKDVQYACSYFWPGQGFTFWQCQSRQGYAFYQFWSKKSQVVVITV